jgi:hypothetical protein
LTSLSSVELYKLTTIIIKKNFENVFACSKKYFPQRRGEDPPHMAFEKTQNLLPTL